MSVTFEKDESFGVHDGKNVSKYTISNSSGLSLVCVDYGATVISVKAPDRHGVSEEISLNYTTLENLIAKYGPHFGCTAGRYANRIKLGKFTIDGVETQLNTNNGVNHLHGGRYGFDTKVWDSRIVRNAEDSGVEFTYFSPDGDEKYPGNAEITVTILMSHSTNSITFNFAAKALDKPTVMNLCNHTYWNLSGNFKRKIPTHEFQLSCSRYVPVDSTLIPTGELAQVAGTPFAFTHPTLLSEGINGVVSGGGVQGIDHCYVVDAALDAQTGAFKYDPSRQRANKQEFLRHMATLKDTESGRCMTVYGTQPGIQVYTANFLSQDAANAPFVQHNGVCLETQHLPDSPNNPHFPSAVLRAGEDYFHQAVHVFSVI